MRSWNSTKRRGKRGNVWPNSADCNLNSHHLMNFNVATIMVLLNRFVCVYYLVDVHSSPTLINTNRIALLLLIIPKRNKMISAQKIIFVNCRVHSNPMQYSILFAANCTLIDSYYLLFICRFFLMFSHLSVPKALISFSTLSYQPTPSRQFPPSLSYLL